MPHVHAAAALALAAALGSAAVRAGDAADDSRQAIRCGTIFTKMAEATNTPEADKPNLTVLAGRMIEIYMRDHKDASAAMRWSDELVEELKTYADGTDPEFISREMAKCEALVRKENGSDNEPDLVPASPDEPGQSP